jgi:phage host-nuclease inhibitor protein Gam
MHSRWQQDLQMNLNPMCVDRDQQRENQHSHVIAMLQNKVTQLSTDFGRRVGEVSALRSTSAQIQTLSGEISALKAEIAQKLKDPVLEQLSTEFNEV